MLDPDTVIAAIVGAFQSIPALTAIMGTDPDTGASNIVGHYYYYGGEQSVTKALFEMSAPSMLIAYKNVVMGNFSQIGLWRHNVECYFQPPSVNGAPSPISMPHLIWLAFNSPVAVNNFALTDGLNIRQVRLMDMLLPMDTPNSLAHPSQSGGSDVWMTSMSLWEIGDVGVQ